jgi:hypothetical protein
MAKNRATERVLLQAMVISNAVLRHSAMAHRFCTFAQ